jgi:NADH-quinone oxidoreductase subunit L
MLLSTVVAVAGIGLATRFFLQRPDLAAGVAARFSGVHRTLLNKYYVDELYNAVIVQPIKRLSTVFLWRGMDAGVIDGTVNAVGLVVEAGARCSGVCRPARSARMRCRSSSAS